MKVHKTIAAQAYDQGVDLLVFPELSLTGYTCQDLFLQSVLIDGAWEALTNFVSSSSAWPGMTMFVGIPFTFEHQLFNCAAVVKNGKLLGLVPKIHLPNYNEFYEQRHFTSGCDIKGRVVAEAGDVPFGTDLIFQISPLCRVGIEICEDLWVPQVCFGVYLL